jgi:hypothetical protein
MTKSLQTSLQQCFGLSKHAQIGRMSYSVPNPNWLHRKIVVERIRTFFQFVKMGMSNREKKSWLFYVQTKAKLMA